MDRFDVYESASRPGPVAPARASKLTHARQGTRRVATSVRFVSAGSFLPEDRLTTPEIEDRIQAASPSFKLRRGMIKAYTGIDARHHARPDVQASDLAVFAAKNALARANAAPSDVDLLIFGSASQDMVEPATAHIVAAKLGLRCPVFDVKNACNSWLNGVQVATSLLTTGAYRTALVVTGECPSRAIRWSVGDLRELFASAAGYTMGDAGAAALLAYDPACEGIFSQEFRAASEHWQIATLPGGGSVNPRGDEFSYFTGDGSRLRDAFVSFGPQLLAEAVAASGTTYERVRRIFCHQVTMPFLRVFLGSTGIPEDKLVVTVPELGNIASATLPLQLSRAMEQGLVSPGDEVLFVGLGGGLSLGTIFAKL